MRQHLDARRGGDTFTGSHAPKVVAVVAVVEEAHVEEAVPEVREEVLQRARRLGELKAEEALGAHVLRPAAGDVAQVRPEDRAPFVSSSLHEISRLDARRGVATQGGTTSACPW